MGLIKALFGIGPAVRDVAEVFVPNATKAAQIAHRDRAASMAQFGSEFNRDTGLFNRFVNALNRLPRPVLAIGTVGLFVYAMTDPVGFSMRMQGLDTIPRELWWLLGAVVSFYFGARELHYTRAEKRLSANVQPPKAPLTHPLEKREEPTRPTDLPQTGNAAVQDWRAASR